MWDYKAVREYLEKHISPSMEPKLREKIIEIIAEMADNFSSWYDPEIKRLIYKELNSQKKTQIKKKFLTNKSRQGKQNNDRR